MRWLKPAVEKFPRSHKFTLGERIYQGALNVLDGLVEATDSRHATPVLLQVNLRLENCGFCCARRSICSCWICAFTEMVVKEPQLRTVSTAPFRNRVVAPFLIEKDRYCARCRSCCKSFIHLD